jgi:hypothetical protein
MKNSILALSFILLTSLFIGSCNTEECHECHYEDANNNKVELGEFCDEALEAIEANGHSTNDTTYEVHCHEH